MKKQKSLFSGLTVQQPKDKRKTIGLAQKTKKPKKSGTRKKSARTVEEIVENLKAYHQRVFDKLPDFSFGLITDKEKLWEYKDKIIENGVVSFDTETTGTDPHKDHVVGFSMYTPNQKAVYVPTNHDNYDGNMPFETVRAFLNALIFKSLTHEIVVPMANASFDQLSVKNSYQYTKYIRSLWDVNLAGKFLNENDKFHNLKFLWEKYIIGTPEDDIEPDSYKKLFGDHTFNEFNPEDIYMYPAVDAVMTYQLYEFQKTYLSDQTEEGRQADLADAAKTFKTWNLLSEVISSMRDIGVGLDDEKIQEAEEKFSQQLQERRDAFDKYVDSIAEKYLTPLKENDPEVFDKIDFPLNPASPTQLMILLYDAMGLQPNGKKSTSRPTLEQLSKKYPEHKKLFDIIFDYRDTAKLYSTYVKSLQDAVNPETGKIHAQFKPYGAVTGRFSSKDPNLQNIPNRKEIGKVIRKMFIPSDGYYLLGSDFS